MVENFDEEQIWQELELQNFPILRHFELIVKKATNDMDIMMIEEDEGKNEDEVAEENITDVEEELSEEEEEDDEQVVKQRTKAKKSSSRAVEKFSDEDSDVDFDVDALETQAKQQQQIKRKNRRGTGFGSEVDDRFFKLSEMEAFLEDVEKKEMDGDDDDDDSEIDYFQDIPSGEEDGLDLEEGVMAKRKKVTFRPPCPHPLVISVLNINCGLQIYI